MSNTRQSIRSTVEASPDNYRRKNHSLCADPGKSSPARPTNQNIFRTWYIAFSIHYGVFWPYKTSFSSLTRPFLSVPACAVQTASLPFVVRFLPLHAVTAAQSNTLSLLRWGGLYRTSYRFVFFRSWYRLSLAQSRSDAFVPVPLHIFWWCSGLILPPGQWCDSLDDTERFSCPHNTSGKHTPQSLQQRVQGKRFHSAEENSFWWRYASDTVYTSITSPIPFCLPIHPFSELFFWYNEPATNSHTWKVFFMHQLVCRCRGHPQYLADNLCIQKQRQLVITFVNRFFQSDTSWQKNKKDIIFYRTAVTQIKRTALFSFSIMFRARYVR